MELEPDRQLEEILLHDPQGTILNFDAAAAPVSATPVEASAAAVPVETVAAPVAAAAVPTRPVAVAADEIAAPAAVAAPARELQHQRR